MRVAIMQPYLLPYIGYFQLIRSVDLFIVYDSIKYTKRGWINRNRILRNGAPAWLTVPLRQGSDYLDICERELVANFSPNKLLNQIRGAYQQAPFFEKRFPVIQDALGYRGQNLFMFLHHSLLTICDCLKITTEIRVSSSIEIDPNLRCQDKVIGLCRAVGAKTYINAIGGKELYSKNVFLANNLELKYLRAKSIEYPQFGDEFVPGLSIVDVMMFNSLASIEYYLTLEYDLID